MSHSCSNCIPDEQLELPYDFEEEYILPPSRKPVVKLKCVPEARYDELIEAEQKLKEITEDLANNHSELERALNIVARQVPQLVTQRNAYRHAAALNITEKRALDNAETARDGYKDALEVTNKILERESDKLNTLYKAVAAFVGFDHRTKNTRAERWDEKQIWIVQNPAYDEIARLLKEL